MGDTNRKDNTYCCVPQCKSKGTDPSLSFHKFPDEKSMLSITKLGSHQVFNRRNEWIRVLKMGKKVSHRMSVCSLHFQETDYLYPSLPRKRKHLKKTAVPSLNLPTLDYVSEEISAKEDKLVRIKQRKFVGLAKRRFPVNKEQRAAWGRAVNRKTWEQSKSSILYSEHSDESQMDKTSLSSVHLRASGIPTAFKPLTASLQNMTAAAEENCSWKGCAAMLHYRISSRPDSETGEVRELTFQNVKSSSKKHLQKQLKALQLEIASLKIYAEELQLQHMKLVEQQSPLIKNVHCIRQDAVEGDLMAIILLNRIVSYNKAADNLLHSS